MAALKCGGKNVSIGFLPPSLPPQLAGIEWPEMQDRVCAPAPNLYSSPAFDVATPPPNACAI
jgi:hypothetical protein